MLEASPLLVFICNAIAIVPLSSLLTDATEAIAARAGDTVGALLNITFGNLVELILLYVHLFNSVLLWSSNNDSMYVIDSLHKLTSFL